MFSGSLKRLKDALRGGLTPDKLALTLCIGLAVGVLPVLWGATLLCMGIGQRLRLNHCVLQAVNYLLYPLQIALFVPFCLLGERFFPWGPRIPENLFPALLAGRPSAGLHLLAWVAVKAVAAWFVTAVPLSACLYPPLLAVLKRRNA
ncbi:DUF2062 domain-containing protein [Geobacter sp. SVR]|uniref:DUF2062 domain-containing protein n=1 Tax=Geobacter sp. SVR TaxID=2495594 RepID=UPI00143EFDA1|nr:DUF2062 domain-containing protein [Geobacter sp. SVR]BCS53375.1 hypothetical protein GSVR_16830 [Geobacter sp. SVR]GCF85499.1 membrane protein [Geobacter sp. SVR]